MLNVFVAAINFATYPPRKEKTTPYRMTAAFVPNFNLAVWIDPAHLKKQYRRNRKDHISADHRKGISNHSHLIFRDGETRRKFDYRAYEVSVIICFDVLHNGRHAFESHTCVD